MGKRKYGESDDEESEGEDESNMDLTQNDTQVVEPTIKKDDDIAKLMLDELDDSDFFIHHDPTFGDLIQVCPYDSKLVFKNFREKVIANIVYKSLIDKGQNERTLQAMFETYLSLNKIRHKCEVGLRKSDNPKVFGYADIVFQYDGIYHIVELKHIGLRHLYDITFHKNKYAFREDFSWTKEGISALSKLYKLDAVSTLDLKWSYDDKKINTVRDTLMDARVQVMNYMQQSVDEKNVERIVLLQLGNIVFTCSATNDEYKDSNVIMYK